MQLFPLKMLRNRKEKFKNFVLSCKNLANHNSDKNFERGVKGQTFLISFLTGSSS